MMADEWVFAMDEMQQPCDAALSVYVYYQQEWLSEEFPLVSGWTVHEDGLPAPWAYSFWLSLWFSALASLHADSDAVQ